MWNGFIILLVYMVFAWGTMYLVTGPPLEWWLRRRRTTLESAELYRWRDRLMVVWAIVNLILMILWFWTFRDIAFQETPL